MRIGDVLCSGSVLRLDKWMACCVHAWLYQELEASNEQGRKERRDQPVTGPPWSSSGGGNRSSVGDFFRSLLSFKYSICIVVVGGGGVRS